MHDYLSRERRRGAKKKKAKLATGRGVLGLIFAGYVPLASQSP